MSVRGAELLLACTMRLESGFSNVLVLAFAHGIVELYDATALLLLSKWKTTDRIRAVSLVQGTRIVVIQQYYSTSISSLTSSMKMNVEKDDDEKVNNMRLY